MNTLIHLFRFVLYPFDYKEMAYDVIQIPIIVSLAADKSGKYSECSWL